MIKLALLVTFVLQIPCMLSFEINVVFAVYYALPTAIKRTLGLCTGELAEPK